MDGLGMGTNLIEALNWRYAVRKFSSEFIADEQLRELLAATYPMTGIGADAYDRVLGLGEKGLATSAICAIGRRHSDDGSAYLQKVRYEHHEMVVVI